MNKNNEISPNSESKKNLSWLKILGLFIVGMVVSAVISALIIKTYIFPSEFEPVTLNETEERTLGEKLKSLNLSGVYQPSHRNRQGRLDEPNTLRPEAYSEKGANREILFSEKELNALLAKNTDLARKFAIDLSENLVSAKLLIPLEEDFPILGGKTLRANAGVNLDFAGGRPIVSLKGISIMGVPIPNAWMGGIKNIDLVQEFDDADGFWQGFSEGVEHLSVEEGKLKIKLKK